MAEAADLTCPKSRHKQRQPGNTEPSQSRSISAEKCQRLCSVCHRSGHNK